MTKKTETFPIHIGNAPKNKTEVVVVAINQYKGKKFIDVRVNFMDKNDPDRLIPTKKGITFTLRSFPSILKLILEAHKKLEEVDVQEEPVQSENESQMPEVDE